MKRAWLRTLSVQQVLVGQFLLVVLVAAIMVFLTVAFWRLPLVRAQSEMEQRRATAIAAHHVEVNLQYVEQLTLALSRSINAADQDNRVGQEVFNALLIQLGSRTDFFQGIYVLNKAMEIQDLVASSEMSSRVSDWRGSDLSGLPVVQRVSQSGTAQWSNQYRSPILDRPVVSFVVPIESGYLMTELSVDRLANAVRQSSALDGLMVVVIDGKGEIVAAPDMGQAAIRSNISQWSMVQAAMGGRYEHGSIEMGGQQFVGTAQLLERIGWIVIAGYPRETVVSSRNAAIGIASFTLLVSISVGLAILLWFSKLIKRRLDSSVRFAEAVSHGEYNARLPSTGIRELEALGHSLEQMSHNIQRREAQLKAIVDNTPSMAIQWCDRQGRVLDWNPASSSVLGFTREEALGKTLGSLIWTPQQQAGFLEALADIERTGQPFGPFSGPAKHKDGRELEILSTTFSIPGLSGDLQFVCMEVDITEIKRKEAAIKASEEKFNLFFYASPVPVAVLSPSGGGTFHYVDVNQAWCTLLGYGRDVFVGAEASLGDRLGPLDEINAMLGSLQAHGQTHAREGQLFHQDGQRLRLDVQLGLVHFQGQALVICSLNDVTEKRRIERALRDLNVDLEHRIQRRTENLTESNAALSQAFEDLKKTQAMLVRSEKLASLGSLVAGVAHELNTPIGNGLMAVSTLEQRLKDFRAALAAGLRRSDLDTFVNQVGTATDISTRNLMRASELISSFKQVAVDQTSSQRRRFSVEALVNEILLTLQPILKHVPYRVVVDVRQDVTVDSYPGPLGQVLTNLVQNAVVHAFKDRSEGQIRVTVRLRDPDWVELSVQDDGRGIPVDQLDKVFDPFFTTRLGEGGSGLGLHISHNIVTGVLAGQIQARNRPEGGAEFEVLFPASAPQRGNHPLPLI